jgi:SpoVK/Ycf46/Vps4 family AAA+-type ATPase
VDYDTPTFLRRNLIVKGTESGDGQVECQTKEVSHPELDVLEKLVLPSEAKAALQEAVILVTRGKRAKGRPPVFLFHGPPGTGKTYAAKIVASAMDLPLRTVGLHELMSKYIGETEARTAALFKDAGKRGAALFFDEADSFLWSRDFATRGWEATAVNCLLTCLDAAKTPVFFATNNAGSLDSALDRRLTWKLAFPLPGPAERAAIWQLELKPWGLLRDNVDPAALAASVPLTGGLIHNAVERVAQRLECGLASYETLQADLCFAARAEAEKMSKGDRCKVGFGA